MEFTRLDAVRLRRPLVHCVSNLVSAGDCANLALAVGASPIMALAGEEAAAITAAASATVLNTGTPDEEKFSLCRLWGVETAALGRPLVLDPVGVGASPWRLRRVQELLRLFTPDILRVNLGEAQALTAAKSREQGVDSPVPVALPERLDRARALAERTGAAVLLSGSEDLVVYAGGAWKISGGSGRMAQVTGTGCMLSVLCGVFAAVEPDPAIAAVLAAAFWKVCSQRAERCSAGPGSFRAALFDAAAALTAEELAGEARVEPL